MDANHSSEPETTGSWQRHSLWPLARWTPAFHGHSRWTLAQDGPSDNSRPESPQGAPRCLRAGGGFEGRRRKPQRLRGLHGYVARTVVAAATSAVVQLEALPDSSSARTGAAGVPFATGSLLSDFAYLARFALLTLTGAGTHVKEVIQGMTVAIGEPPRRAFEESGAGMLFWAYDIAVVCFIVATCLFALGFATMPQQCGVGKVPASRALGSEVDQEVGRLKDTGLLVAVILTVFSGRLLSIKRPLVSALLCGL